LYLVLVIAALVAAFLLGLFTPRNRGWIAAAGILVMPAVWGLAVATGAFDDDREGTAVLLTLIFVVPVLVVLWALAVGAGSIVGGRGKQRSDVANPS
jgi:hypothetical protein